MHSCPHASIKLDRSQWLPLNGLFPVSMTSTGEVDGEIELVRKSWGAAVTYTDFCECVRVRLCLRVRVRVRQCAH